MNFVPICCVTVAYRGGAYIVHVHPQDKKNQPKKSTDEMGGGRGSEPLPRSLPKVWFSALQPLTLTPPVDGKYNLRATQYTLLLAYFWGCAMGQPLRHVSALVREGARVSPQRKKHRRKKSIGRLISPKKSLSYGCLNGLLLIVQFESSLNRQICRNRKFEVDVGWLRSSTKFYIILLQ